MKDSGLDVEMSIESVRNVLNDHERRQKTIEEAWQRWQDKRVEGQKIIRIVDQVCTKVYPLVNGTQCLKESLCDLVVFKHSK